MGYMDLPLAINLVSTRVHSVGLSPEDLHQMAVDYKRADSKILFTPLSIKNLSPMLKELN